MFLRNSKFKLNCSTYFCLLPNVLEHLVTDDAGAGGLKGLYGMATDDGCRVLLNASVGDSLYAGNAYYLADLFADRQWRHFAGEFYRRLTRLTVSQLYHVRALRVLVRRAQGMRRNPLRCPEWLAANVREPGEDLRNWLPESIEHVRPTQYRTLLGLDISGVSTAVNFFANRFGLEIRDPYLDWDLADFMLSIPSYYAERPGQLKVIARNAMRGIMLESLRTQSSKGVLSDFFYYGVFKRSRQLLMVLVPLFYLLLKIIGRRLRPLASQVQEAHAGAVSIAEENLGMLPAIKTLPANDTNLPATGNRFTASCILAPKSVALSLRWDRFCNFSPPPAWCLYSH